MATEYVADPGGMDGHVFDLQAVNLHFGAGFTRGGVVPWSGGGVSPLGYVLKSGLVGTIKAGTYVVVAPDPGLGKYEVHVPADVDITHTTANASQPRTDWIIVEINDVGTSSSTKKVRLLSGTAGSGAPPPTLPTSLGNGAAVAIASVNIPANATTLGTITDLRTYTSTPGVLFLPNATVAAGVPEGTAVYLNDVDRLGVTTAGGLAYIHQGKLTQQIATNDDANALIVAGTTTAVKTVAATVAAGALVEFEFLALLEANANGAGWLHLTLSGVASAARDIRFHNHGTAGPIQIGGTLKGTAGSAGTVTAGVSLQNDVSSSSWTIREMPCVLREIQ